MGSQPLNEQDTQPISAAVVDLKLEGVLILRAAADAASNVLHIHAGVRT